jgi:hypothetical protein
LGLLDLHMGMAHFRYTKMLARLAFPFYINSMDSTRCAVRNGRDEMAKFTLITYSLDNTEDAPKFASFGAESQHETRDECKAAAAVWCESSPLNRHAIYVNRGNAAQDAMKLGSLRSAIQQSRWSEV